MSLNIWKAESQELQKVAGQVNINDSTTSETSVWSSKKVSDSLVDIKESLYSDYINLTPKNGATVYGLETPRARRQADVIYLRGSVTINNYSSSEPIFTLPANFKPKTSTVQYFVPCTSGMARIKIDTDGNVLILSMFSYSGEPLSQAGWLTIQGSFAI